MKRRYDWPRIVGMYEAHLLLLIEAVEGGNTDDLERRIQRAKEVIAEVRGESPASPGGGVEE